jgi:hypothetical protein
LHPALGDDPRDYDYKVVEGGIILQSKPDGSCIYVGDKGCTIWDRRPAICRAFDCRVYARSDWMRIDPHYDGRVVQAGLDREI